MRLALQFGHGMMALSKTLVEEWGAGTVILSPRNVAEDRQITLADELRGAGADVLFDPQFYVPHQRHTKLRRYGYWPGAYDRSMFWTGSGLSEMLDGLIELNAQLGAAAVILPGPYCETVDHDWLQIQGQIIAAAREKDANARLYATLALSAEATRNNHQVHELLDDAAEWNVDGVYLCFQHPQTAYLVEDAAWLANVLDIAASFRLRGRYVILGYCNHQQLIAACAGVNEIAAGTWMNLRMYMPETFRDAGEAEPKTHNTWYYAPGALTEFALDRLDLAQTVGVLNSIQVPTGFVSPRAEVLFDGGQPSVSGFNQADAFTHYLTCLRVHVAGATKANFNDTVDAHLQSLSGSERLLTTLHGNGIRGAQRDFGPAIDTNRGAIAALRAQRGPLLARAWARITN